MNKIAFSAAEIRAAFPIFERKVNGAPLVYLDSAASAQKPAAVIETMDFVMRSAYANVHRGVHALANEATSAYEDARAKVARFLGAASPQNIVFTKGGTQAINVVAHGLGLGAGDNVVLTTMEHHSNIVPWHMQRERHGASLRWISVDPDGRLDLRELDHLIDAKTKIVALTHMSNVLGAVTPAREVVELAHAKGAAVLLDGCQAAVHGPVDVAALGADYYVVTGHKLYGPSGIGVLYGSAAALERLAPFEGGGEMIEIVEQDRITYGPAPHRFEAGTPPIVEAIGLGAALDWLERWDLAGVRRHEDALLHQAVEGLDRLSGVTIFGRAPRKGPILAFNLDGAHPHDVAQILDMQGIAVRAGHHCAQPLMRELGVSATARASFGLYNTSEDVDRFLQGVRKAKAMLA